MLALVIVVFLAMWLMAWIFTVMHIAASRRFRLLSLFAALLPIVAVVVAGAIWLLVPNPNPQPIDPGPIGLGLLAALLDWFRRSTIMLGWVLGITILLALATSLLPFFVAKPNSGESPGA